jgi:hypothetical protein
MPWSQEYGAGAMLVVLMGLIAYAGHCRWVTSEAYSSPSIVLISGYGANRYVLDDFRWGGGPGAGRGGDGGRLGGWCRWPTNPCLACGRPRRSQLDSLTKLQPLASRPPGRRTTGCATTPRRTPRS